LKQLAGAELPVVLSPEEVARLLDAAPGLLSKIKEISMSGMEVEPILGWVTDHAALARSSAANAGCQLAFVGSPVHSLVLVGGCLGRAPCHLRPRPDAAYVAFALVGRFSTPAGGHSGAIL